MWMENMWIKASSEATAIATELRLFELKVIIDIVVHGYGVLSTIPLLEFGYLC